MNTSSEENYLKAIYSLSKNSGLTVNTNAVAKHLKTKASSVTDMIKKLHQKNLLNYKKYKGFLLTRKGEKISLNTIRKHRLWEVFLVDHLNFKWDEVHDIAEQIEHINSEQLINSLDKFLGFPKYDPHGDPIPDKNGKISHHEKFMLSDTKKDQKVEIVGLLDSSSSFLQYLEKSSIKIGSKIKIKERLDFDSSLIVKLKGKNINVSEKVTNNLFVKLIK